MSQADFALTDQAESRAQTVARPGRASARAATGEIELSIHDDLPSVEPVWRSLQGQGVCTPFQSFEWLSAWLRNVGAPSGIVPCFVIGRNQAGAPLFALPLAVQAHGMGRELVFLGTDLCDYNAPLLAADAEELDAARFAALWPRIVAYLQADSRFRHDLIRLEKMPPAIGDRPNPMLGLHTSLNPSGSYATPLMSDWDAFYAAKRSSATRRRDRSKRKHLGESGEVKFVSADDPAAALETFAVLVEQKSKTFARHGIRNLFALPGYLDFYRDLAGNPDSGGFVHISRLDVGDQIAATNLGLVFNGCYYHVLASYTDSSELARRGPGAAHLNDLLRYAIERGLTTFDFTIGDERYKRDWCEAVQPLYDHVAVTSWRGAMVAGPAIVLSRVKRAIKQTPVLWAIVVKARAVTAALRGRAAHAPSDAESDGK